MKIICYHVFQKRLLYINIYLNRHCLGKQKKLVSGFFRKGNQKPKGQNSDGDFLLTMYFFFNVI